MVQGGRGRRRPVTAHPRDAGAGHRGDGAADGELTDPVVPGVRHVDDVGCVDDQTARAVESAGGRRHPVHRRAGHVGAEPGDHGPRAARRGVPVDDVILAVADVDVAGAVEGDVAGSVQAGGERGERAARRRLEHLAVVGVGDELVTGGVERHALRVVQPGELGADNAIAEGDLPDARVQLRGDDDVVVGVQRHVGRGVDPGGRGRTVVAAVVVRAHAGEDRGDPGGQIDGAYRVGEQVGDVQDRRRGRGRLVEGQAPRADRDRGGRLPVATDPAGGRGQIAGRRPGRRHRERQLAGDDREQAGERGRAPAQPAHAGFPDRPRRCTPRAAIRRRRRQ
ncbi:hypothetical protein ACWT_4699 [Actinoplanes sp. SE50]|nr:hypothetical protein ACPL_4830 [Actinoplanes sp. SE50/110]ATO84114.1 hypothetical protein ACWT_4699 [Actinoplanes sp. SE50]SLM01524.1 hypothetical protein ACSP50_4760 [Actinoplanes sp. SE50/110]